MIFIKTLFSTICLCCLSACSAQGEKSSFSPDRVTRYEKNHPDNSKPSNSLGSVSKGKIENGKLLPFSGENFHFFDTTSYLSGRAFLNGKVKSTLISSYKQMKILAPNRHFCVMECSHEHGGKLYPHRTHQNGMSVDLMVPLLKNGIPYYELDDMGIQHYLMEFDNSGLYSEDKNVSIDFDLIALHILTLQEEAKKNDLQIDKVILKTELKDELFSTPNGKKLKNSSIYITKSLTPIINALHDDHYHIDFKPIR